MCRFRVCHQPCQTSKDCPRREDGEHQACVVADKPLRICQLDAERDCELHSDCPGDLICGVDGVCRNGCGGDRDCGPEHVCAGGTCAEPLLLDGEGRLTPSERGPREGAPCSYHSDCPPSEDGISLRCRGGFCEVACLGDDRDCGRFERCSTTGSDPPLPGACELIGDPSGLHCSPKDDYPDESAIACACPDGTTGEQLCEPDGSAYGPCTVGMNQCLLP